MVFQPCDLQLFIVVTNFLVFFKSFARMTDNLIRLGKYTVKLKDGGEPEEFCDEMEKFVKIERLDGSSTKKNEVDCNPDELVKAANKYFSLKPPDLIQTSEKLWLGAVYTVQLYFLRFKVLGKSPESLKRMVKAALQGLDESIELFEAWLFVEDFHKYSNGLIHFSKKDFQSRMKEVENFIVKFSQIDEESGSRAAGKIMADVEKCETKKGTIQLGKRRYDYDYIVY
uniref:Uncharacterized protein n=1 Tax=Panagrolaimus sp. JU765 TaxID=591449 RepID=A0AC34R599_9BILA